MLPGSCNSTKPTPPPISSTRAPRTTRIQRRRLRGASGDIPAHDTCPRMPAWNELVMQRLRSPVLDRLAGDPSVWVVGGAVRDALLDREPRELDLVVAGDAVAVAR